MRSRCGGRRLPAHCHWLLSATSRSLTTVLCGIVVVTVLSVDLAVAGEQPTRREPQARSGDLGLLSYLAVPFPGTPARAIYDHCQRLEAALGFCTGVESVRVSSPSLSVRSAQIPPRDKATDYLAGVQFLVQICFSPGFSCPTVNDLAHLCLLAAPDLKPEQFTFVDGLGRPLAPGAVASPPGEETPPPPGAFSPLHWHPLPLVLTAIVALALSGFAIWARRKGSQSSSGTHLHGTVAPVASPETVAALISGESSPVSGAIVALLDDRARAALARRYPAADDLPRPPRTPHSQVRAILEAAQWHEDPPAHERARH